MQSNFNFVAARKVEDIMKGKIVEFKGRFNSIMKRFDLLRETRNRVENLGQAMYSNDTKNTG